MVEMKLAKLTVHYMQRKALRPLGLVVAASCLLVLPLPLIWSWRSIPSKQTSDNPVLERIEHQLMQDQKKLDSISQYMYNAYFDTRSTLGGRKFVRVIAVLDTKLYTGNFMCQFMRDNGDMSFSSVAKMSKIGFGMSHEKHSYLEFVLSCPIVTDLTLATFLFVQTEDASHRSHVIQVRHNLLSLGKKPAYPDLIINCVSVTFGRPNAHRLIEWLEAQKLLKMDKVQLHFYHMLNKEFESVAQAYIAEGFLDVRSIKCPFCAAGHEERLGLLLMSPAINQCFYENLGRYKFTAVYDLDEIIVPQKHADYPNLLNYLESRVNTSSFTFRNWYQFDELGEDASVPMQMHMLRHSFRTKDASPEGYSVKSIHRSQSAVAMHNHNNWEDVPAPGTLTGSYSVALDVGLNEHYKKCHFDQTTCNGMTQVKDRRDGSRLKQLIGDDLIKRFQLKVKQLLPVVSESQSKQSNG